MEELNTKTDEELLAMSLVQPGLFEHIVSRYEEAFLRKATYMVRTREIAEELVQDTFVKIYVNAGRFHKVEGATFRSWGYRILVNTCLTYITKNKKSGISVDLDPELADALSDEKYSELDEKTARDSVWRALVKLPISFQKLLTLHLKDKTHREIAEEIGSTEGAVKVQIHRAKKALKEVINTMET